MNYIAHINLAEHTQSSPLGNFLGDFVKGELNNWSVNGVGETLSNPILKGIELHRSIDSFTDSHIINQQLRALFPKSIRRMSGIVLDVYFDHLLCQNWRAFNDKPIHHSFNNFYGELAQNESFISDRFQKVKSSLLQHQWLIDYQSMQGCLRAFQQIEKRLSNRIMFAQHAYEFLSKHQGVIEQQFLEFYPVLIAHCKQKIHYIN